MELKVEDFMVGFTYKIRTKDWETPFGEIIPGKEIVRTILEPASGDNTNMFDGNTLEPAAELDVKHLKKFLRVRNADTGKAYFLHPRTIEKFELIESTNKFFRLTHEYDIGDRSLYFTFDATGLNATAKELAVYLQFKAEDIFDNSICLDHITIIRFLSLFGAKQLEFRPDDEFETIDMYWDRESRCGDWYAGRFGDLDKKYSDKACAFLNAEVQENQLAGEWHGLAE